MSRKIIWSEGQDTQIRRLRTEGATWDVVASVLDLARCTVIERARTLGLEHPPAHAAAVFDDADRAPLRSGHIETWGAINRGTCLEDMPFKTPAPIR